MARDKEVPITSDMSYYYIYLVTFYEMTCGVMLLINSALCAIETSVCCIS
jgi:hypothetical protein